MGELKTYIIPFETLCELSDDRTIRSLLAHFRRINPEEHGRGVAYKYSCPICNQLTITLHNYKASFEVDVAQLSNICPKCLALLIQLNLGDFR